jgi:hypothetical protein
MAKKNKLCLLLAALCLTLSASPSYAWQAARGAYGGAAARGNYGGAAVRAPSGAAAVRTPAGNTAYRPPSSAYHPPVPAYGYRPPAYYGGNYGYSSGQVAAAGVAGLAVGAMVGSSAAKSSQPTTTTVVQQAPAPAPSSIPIGTNLNSLPSGCQLVVINSIQYFQCGSSWLRQYTGYFQVVPAPY